MKPHETPNGTVKRIATLQQGSQPRGNSPHAIASRLAWEMAMASTHRLLGADAINFSQLIENELAFARFQGYRQAMDDAEADRIGAWPPTGFGPAIDRKNA